MSIYVSRKKGHEFLDEFREYVGVEREGGSGGYVCSASVTIPYVASMGGKRYVVLPSWILCVCSALNHSPLFRSALVGSVCCRRRGRLGSQKRCSTLHLFLQCARHSCGFALEGPAFAPWGRDVLCFFGFPPAGFSLLEFYLLQEC